MRFFNEHRFFFLFLVLSLLIRAQGLDLALVSDEAGWAIDIHKLSFEPLQVLHPPLMLSLYRQLFASLDESTLTYRLLPFFFSLVNFTLLYLLGLKLYGKRTAIFAVALATFSFWATLAALQVDIDGSLLTMCYLFVMYCLVQYLDQERIQDIRKQRLWLILLGVGLGTTLLSKYTGIVVFLIVAAYLWFVKKSVLGALRVLFLVSLIAAMVFAFFPLWAYLTGNDLFAMSLSHTGGVYYFTLLRPVTYLFLWATPLLFYFFLLGVFKLQRRDGEKFSSLFGGIHKHLLCVLWAAFVFLFFAIVISGKAPTFDRYLMPIIPPLILVSASFLSEFQFSRRDFYLGGLVTLGTVLVFFTLNSLTTNLLYHSITNYLHAALTLHWDFLFPYTGSSGPFFWIAWGVIGITLLVTTLLFVFLLFVSLSTQQRKMLVLLLVSVSLAFNIVLVSEYLFSLTQPSQSEITHEIVAYLEEQNVQNKTLFTTLYQQQIMFYINGDYPPLEVQKVPYIIDDVGEYPYYEKMLFENANGAVAIAIDMPYAFDRESKLGKELMQRCARKTFSNHGRAVADVFIC